MSEKEDLTAGFLKNRTTGQEERSFAPWIIAGAVVAVVVGVLIFMSAQTSKRPGGSGQPDAYASRLTLSGIELSQSSNGVGSQITYVDGQITNRGDKTVSGVTVRTTFADAFNQPGQEETMVLNLIRTREPYIDIESVAAAPIKPGETKAFRLIFDHLSTNWNQQAPQIKVMQVQTR